MEELHLIVLWEKARAFEDRIVEDIRRHVRVVASFTETWPCDPRNGYARFYGAKAALAAGKVESCGGGAFRVLIVCDKRPRYGWRKTSRGTESVNLRLFAMKKRYRSWAGGHRVHTTNSRTEAARDIFLLTGRCVADWFQDASTEDMVVFAPGWEKLADPGTAIHDAPPPLATVASQVANLCEKVFPVKDVAFLGERLRIPESSLKELVFSAVGPDETACSVHYLTVGRETLVTDFDFGRRFANRMPQNAFRPLFFRLDENGELFGIGVRQRLPGFTLREAVRRGLSAEDSGRMAKELLEIAKALAELGLCHRNLTPDELWVGDDGHVRVADFSFAVDLDGGRETGWLSRELEVLANLGGGYRLDAGRWCDRQAIAKCVELLPSCPTRDAVLAELMDAAAFRVYRVRLRHRFVRTALFRFVHLSFRNLFRLFRRKEFRNRALWTLLAHALGLPVHGNDGWRDLPCVFHALNEHVRYVVLRNYEMLPDGFDPSLHGDIDLLVDDLDGTVRTLHARKVVRKPWRVHYEIVVSGVPVRLDLRHVGDDYYCEEWERDVLLTRRRLPCGVFVPTAEHAFHTLVYHALFQKLAIASDYPPKIAALAKEAGVGGTALDDWRRSLVSFMQNRRYRPVRPEDRSVKYNPEAVKEAFGEVR